MYLIFTKELNGLISESSSRCNVATNKSLCDKNAGLNSFIPSITDGVHRTENFAEIIPVFSTFSNFFKKKKKYI